ncbi:MAG TPA: hypothetical protein VFS21_19305 [Roseiflexaceae bacterium]|nr:hypothetical protein [Roseiflexaceae bacterium]
MPTRRRPTAQPAAPAPDPARAALVADLAGVFEAHGLTLREAVRLLPELGTPLQQELLVRRQRWLVDQGLLDEAALRAHLGLEPRELAAAQRLGLLAPEPWPAALLLPAEWAGSACDHYRPDLALSEAQRGQIRAAVLLGRDAAAAELGVTPAQFDQLRRQAGFAATAGGTYRLADLDGLRDQAVALLAVKPGRGPTAAQRWAGLNDRQRAYLRAIYAEDQAQEEAERGRWKHGMRSRPAAEWRPLAYGLLPGLPPIPSALYAAIERLGLRDEGTGATFQALEVRGLIICRYCQPGQQTELSVELTRLGRQVARAGGAPVPARDLLPDWAWRWLATLSTASAGAAMGERTREFLHKRGLIVLDEWGLARISDAGRAYYEQHWVAYRQRYPHIDARPPASIAEALASEAGQDVREVDG